MKGVARASPERELNSLERGILWPLVYASLFEAPIARSELRSRLAGVRATDDDLSRGLHSPVLHALVTEEDGFVWLRESLTAERRTAFLRRREETEVFLRSHAAVLDFVGTLPGLRFAALSGGCAHGTADDRDVDVFAIACRGRLFRTLLRAMVGSKLRGWRRVLCLNYIVDEQALALPWKDFYGAYELTSLKPFKGSPWMSTLVAANPWVETIFPNFHFSTDDGQNPLNQDIGGSGRALEFLARMIQRTYLHYRLPQGSGVELSEHVVRLHTRDHRDRLRASFAAALHKTGLEAPPWI